MGIRPVASINRLNRLMQATLSRQSTIHSWRQPFFSSPVVSEGYRDSYGSPESPTVHSGWGSIVAFCTDIQVNKMSQEITAETNHHTTSVFGYRQGLQADDSIGPRSCIRAMHLHRNRAQRPSNDKRKIQTIGQFPWQNPSLRVPAWEGERERASETLTVNSAYQGRENVHVCLACDSHQYELSGKYGSAVVCVVGWLLTAGSVRRRMKTEGNRGVMMIMRLLGPASSASKLTRLLRYDLLPMAARKPVSCFPTCLALTSESLVGQGPLRQFSCLFTTSLLLTVHQACLHSIFHRDKPQAADHHYP